MWENKLRDTKDWLVFSAKNNITWIIKKDHYYAMTSEEIVELYTQSEQSFALTPQTKTSAVSDFEECFDDIVNQWIDSQI